jgi:hypothetical protein
MDDATQRQRLRSVSELEVRSMRGSYQRAESGGVSTGIGQIL